MPTDLQKLLKTKSKPRPSAMVCYGPPGVGKTSLAAASQSPVFMIDIGEDGITTLQNSGLADPSVPVLPPCSTWQQALDLLAMLAGEDHDRRTLVIDALGGFERLCHEHVCAKEYGGDWGPSGFASFARGYETSLGVWRNFLQRIDVLREKRGMSIIALAHSIIKPYRNPDGDDFDRHTPDLHQKTWGLTHKWADLILFANYHVVTTRDGGRAKGKGGQLRFLNCEYTAAADAKNRHGLPPEIAMGESGEAAWKNLIEAIKTNKRES